MQTANTVFSDGTKRIHQDTQLQPLGEGGWVGGNRQYQGLRLYITYKSFVLRSPLFCRMGVSMVGRVHPSGVLVTHQKVTLLDSWSLPCEQVYTVQVSLSR